MSDLFDALQQHDKSQATNRPTRGSVQQIDGNRVNVLVRGSSTILRNVKAVGAASVIGQDVVLTWENGIPIAHIVGGTAVSESLVSFARGPAGPEGPMGPAGANGADGVDGAHGPEGPVGSVSAASTLGLTELSATPATPAVGTLLVYAKDDHKAYKLDSDGVETEIGTGSGGGGGNLSHDQSGGAGDTYGALVGDIDGVNTTFTVSKGQYISGSLQVFLNGQLLIQGSSEGWVETTPGSGIFDLNDAPVAGDELSTSYQTVSDVVGTGDRTDQSGGASDTYGALSGAIDGVNTTFTVSTAEYVSGTLRVYLNGQLQTQGTGEDWTETNSDVGQFDFAVPPVAGDQITVTYKIPGAGSGDADTLDGYHAEDFAPADQSGSVVLTDNYLITSSDVWQDTGLSVDLPSVGRYELHADVRGAIKATFTPGSSWIAVMLHDDTANADVINSERMVVLTGSSDTQFQMTAPIYKQVIVDGPTTISLRVMRSSSNSSVVWLTSLIGSNYAGRTEIAFKKTA